MFSYVKKITDIFRRFLQPHGKTSFIYEMNSGAKVLDIGCWNDSAYRFKLMRSDCYYIGIDIDHDNTGNKQIGKFPDEVLITSPNRFHEPIDRL